jgi:hypothetical protein
MGLDLCVARGLVQEQLDEAVGDKNTKLPGGLTIKIFDAWAPGLDDDAEQHAP